jgi:hypothetical protein
MNTTTTESRHPGEIQFERSQGRSWPNPSHSKLPFCIALIGDKARAFGGSIEDANGNQIALVTVPRSGSDVERKANAELIVKACNSYPHAERLAEACSMYVRACESCKAAKIAHANRAIREALADWSAR